MNDDVRLAPYARADREDVFAFLREIYPAEQSDRLIRQWDWKYDANPYRHEAEPYVVVLKQGPRIVGLFGGFPLRCVVDGRDRWLSHGGDWVIHPDCRDRRLSRSLWEGHEAHQSLRFSWQNESSFRKARWRVTIDTARLAPLVKPIDLAHVLQKLTGRRGIGEIAGALAHALASLRPKREAAPGITIARVDAFDERFDRLWQRSRGDYPVMIVRDRRYLSWRFLGRPDAVYTMLAATRGEDLLGYLVVRSTDRLGERWGYLVDFLVRDRSPQVFAMLVEHGIECLRGEGVKAISCRVVVPPYRRSLYRLGFLPLRWGPRGYLSAYVPASDPQYLAYRAVRQWFVTMGDGDLEFDV